VVLAAVEQVEVVRRWLRRESVGIEALTLAVFVANAQAIGPLRFGGATPTKQGAVADARKRLPAPADGQRYRRGVRLHDRQPPTMAVVMAAQDAKGIVFAGFDQGLQRSFGHFGYHHL